MLDDSRKKPGTKNPNVPKAVFKVDPKRQRSRKDLDARKAKLPCRNCHQLGHWEGECPHPKKTQKNKTVQALLP